MSSSSSSRKKEPKLCVRNQTCFKRWSFSSTKKTNLALREKTMLKKAYELSTLCGNDVCIIHYDRNGQLVRTWPEDQSKVRDMAERFSRLSVQEKLKKNTNLSQCLNKRLIDDKKTSLENENKRIKYTEKILEFEGLLENKLQILLEMVCEIRNSEETDQSSLALISEQYHNFAPPVFFPKDLPSSSTLVEYPLMNSCPYDLVPGLQQQTGSFTNLLTSGGDVSTTNSLNHPRQDNLEQHHNYFPVYPVGSKDLASSSSTLIEDPLMNFCPYVPVPHHQQQRQSFTNLRMGGGHVSTSTEQDLSRLVYNSAAATEQRQSKYSIFVLNHETAT